jgi:hypothetical protein
MPNCLIVSLDKTWIAIGTFCRFSLRLWAVTMTSPTVVEALSVEVSAARATP